MSILAAKAANWWADRLWADRLWATEPIDQRISNRDGRDMAAEILEAQLNMLNRLGSANKQAPPADARERFVTELIRLIEERGNDAYLAVDYDPNHCLHKAAEASGHKFFQGDWPWKTSMWVKPDSIRVSEGYGAQYVTIHP